MQETCSKMLNSHGLIRDYPSCTLIHLLDQQVQLTPHGFALVAGNQKLTFNELDCQANQWAHFFRANGVSQNSLVAVNLPRGIELVIALLAILKAGAIYLPIDINQPQSRIKNILAKSQANFFLTQKESFSIKDISCTPLFVNRFLQEKYPSRPLSYKNVPSDVSYVIYTSGSSGEPKGVANIHEGTVNRLLWMQEQFKATPEDKILHKTTISFDVAVWELWWPLICGATLVLASENAEKDPEILAQDIVQYSVTIMHFVPSQLSAFLASGNLLKCQSLRYVISSGEALSSFLSHDFYQQAYHAELYNLYGPTEASIDVSFYHCRHNESLLATTVPIGKAIANTQLFVLDKNQKNVPIGQTGELYIAGKGLAQGYWLNEELTQQKFVEIMPLKEKIRAYKTGDLARWLPDGNLEFIGRIDEQIKIRGFRIEPAEIEAVLLKYPLIQHASVIPKKTPNGSLGLVGYLVTHDSEQFDKKSLSQFLIQQLPEYMIPQGWVVLEKLPLTLSGKLDKKALPEPNWNAEPENRILPNNKIEQLLVEIWEKILCTAPIGVEDNFFALGGDSILAIQIASSARKHNLVFQPTGLLRAQTIRQLAIMVTQEEQRAPLQQITKNQVFSLSAIQQWFFSLALKNLNYFNMSYFLETEEMIDTDRLKSAFEFVIQHHDIFHLLFSQKNGAWHQAYKETRLNSLVQVVVIPKTADEKGYILEQAKLTQQQLSLEKGVLIKVLLFKNSKKVRAFIAIHHVVMDGVSWRILLEDVYLTYKQMLDGNKPKIEHKSCSFSSWLEAVLFYADNYLSQSSRNYWRRVQEKGIIPICQSTGLFPDKEMQTVRQELDASITKRIFSNVFNHWQVSINAILLTSLLIAFHRCKKINAFSIDLEGHGREDIEREIDNSRTIGWFTSIYPVTLKLNHDGDALLETLNHIQATLADIPNNGFDYLLLKAKDNSFHQARPQIKFNYLGKFNSDQFFQLSDLLSVSQSDGENCFPYLLDIELIQIKETIVMNWRYNNHYFLTEEVERLANEYCKVMTEISHLAKKNEITKIGETKSYPLLPFQQGLLSYALGNPESKCYFIQALFSLDSKVNIERFKTCWQLVVNQAEALRGFFPGFSSYAVEEKVITVWQEYDWSNLSVSIQNSKLTLLLREDRQHSINLAKAPLFRLSLINKGNNEFLMLFSYHHILLDGWSLTLLIERINRCYQSLTHDTPIDSVMHVSHPDYLSWFKQQDAQEASNYWKNYLNGVEELSFISYYGNNSHSSEEDYAVDGSLSISLPHLREFLSRNKISLNTVMNTGLGILLNYLTGKEDVVFGTTISLRPIEIGEITASLGLYINTLPVRFLNHEKRLNRVLKHLHETFLNHTKYGYYPLHQMKAESSFADCPTLFDALLVFEGYLDIEKNMPHSVISSAEVREETHYGLTFLIQPRQNINIRVLSNTKRYPKEFIEKLLKYYIHIIDGILSEKYSTISSIPILTEKDEGKLLWDYNKTHNHYPKEIRLESLVETVARFSPKKVAVVDSCSSWSYEELNNRVNKYAALLKQYPDAKLIAVLLDRRIELIAILLAIVKAGAAFLPLDVNLPKNRITSILTTAKVRLVISENSYCELIEKSDIKILTINELETKTVDSFSGCDKHLLTSESLAYVMFTSGSTGEPKGVMVSHRSLINRLWWMKNHLKITPKDKFLQKTCVGFDVALGEIFCPLIAGATLVLAKPGEHFKPSYLVDAILNYQITVVHFVPSLLQVFLSYIAKERYFFPMLRAVICSGEALTRENVSQFFDSFEHTKLYNLYGPTEATIEVTYHECNKEEKSDVPLGMPIANTQIYITNQQGKTLPEGLPGEIIISGDSVTKGYLYDENLTNQKFLDNPLIKNCRMYHSGDFGYRDEKGIIYYLGRIDDQIKIRGLRVELKAIENALLQHENVKEAVVLCNTRENDKQLVAFIIEKMPCAEERAALIQYNGFLEKALPKYMLPGKYLSLSEFPYALSGKIDKKILLKKIPKELKFHRDFQNKTLSEKILQFFSIVLELQKVDLQDSFFALGGHSLVALRLIAMINEEFSLKIEVSDIFSHPILGDFIQLASEKLQLASPREITISQPCVVPIKVLPGKPAIFLIHPIGGTVYRFQSLANYLSDNWSIYGIEDPGLHDDDCFFDSLETMASFYNKEIRKIQPHGPYRLGGASLGAIIAIEMGVQLLNKGEKVHPVLLFDGWAIYPEEVSTAQYLENYLSSQYQYLKENLTERQFKGVPPQRLKMHCHRAKLLKQYGYHGKKLPGMVLFKAKKLLPVLALHNDNSNHWESILHHSIPTYLIDGDHDSMFLPPHVPQLALAVELYLMNKDLSSPKRTTIPMLTGN